jgi:hypothetical protein
MAVGLRIKFAGGTEDQYRAMHSTMNVEGDPPEGMIFHSAGPIDDGWGVIDFWESREDFDRFMESRLGPAVGELGDRAFEGQPDIKQFPVANITHGRD